MKRAMRKINPSRAGVAKSMREVEILWRPPDPDDRQENAAGAGTEAALNKTKTSHPKYKPTRRGPQ